jgi:hypothetical protein
MKGAARTPETQVVDIHFFDITTRLMFQALEAI